MPAISRLVLLLATLAAALGALPARPQDFPPITAEERALREVPGEPNAPAVVLFRKGEIQGRGYGFFGSHTAHLRVQTRVKILTEHGQSNGEISFFHSEHFRLKEFSGRTVLPDGTIVPVSANAKFQRTASESKGIFVTSVAFPSVQVGAILDCSYELVSLYPSYLEPWYLSDGPLSVRYAEVVYKSATDWRMQLYSRSPLGVVIHKEETDGLSGRVLRVWAENLPALPREPHGPPFGELAAQVLVLPAEADIHSSQPKPVLSSWFSTGDMYARYYESIAMRRSGVRQQVSAIASGTPRQKAEALYRFVRDEIRTEPTEGLAVDVDEDSSVGKVLSGRRGTATEKALLLAKMLSLAKVPAGLAWARDRTLGAVTDPRAPNPGWFDAVFVVVELDGQKTFLDPSRPGRGFGQLPIAYEGTSAVILGSHPVDVALPAIPWEQNLRRTEVELVLDSAGRLSGSGSLLLTGHAAEDISEGHPDPSQPPEAWTQWLAGRFPGFQISGVKTDAAPDERRVTVTWMLAQRQEEVLGDEVSLTPSAPLGPLAQPFVQSSTRRRTGVRFDYAYREEAVLRLHWPEGWKVAGKPTPAAVDSPVGSWLSEETQDDLERRFSNHRRLDVKQREIEIGRYETLRSLFSAAERNDQQQILLVRAASR